MICWKGWKNFRVPQSGRPGFLKKKGGEIMKKVFVSGASGNVGKVIVKALLEREDMVLVGGCCREAGEDLGTLAGARPA